VECGPSAVQRDNEETGGKADLESYDLTCNKCRLQGKTSVRWYDVKSTTTFEGEVKCKRPTEKTGHTTHLFPEVPRSDCLDHTTQTRFLSVSAGV
jgi:hypothetical protein